VGEKKIGQNIIMLMIYCCKYCCKYCY